MKPHISTLPLYGWILVGALLLSQSIWVFRDAQKKKRFPWLWGLWALTSCPGPLIVYLIAVRKIFRKKQ